MPHGYQGRKGGPSRQDDGSTSSSIPKQFYDSIRKQIDDFKVGPKDKLVFDPMDRAQRKAVHDMANRLRVISKSSGEGSNRHCVISRRPAATMQAASHCSESEPVSLTHEQKKTIVAFIKEYPIEESDIEAHVTVSTEARECVRESRKFQAPRAEPQIPPSATASAEVNRVRHELPAFHARQRVLDNIEKNKVTLITGGTGCGKTTQVPQFLLERATEMQKAVRIIVTQPRRLPAISVAQRVACERRETVGQTVGYHIRLEQKTSSSTVLTYCTSGVLLRMLTQDDLARDCTHIILDEVHEREQNTDYLLIALKQALRKRHDLKVILMSATMEGNLEMFMEYFEEFNIAHVDIPSRLYPVTNFHLADVMALTGYTPPESIYGGVTTFSNGFGNGFGAVAGGNPHSNSFSVGNWGSGGSKESSFSATNWNNSEAKTQSAHSYHKPQLTPSNSAVSHHMVAVAGGVRAVQSAANLPSFGGNGAPSMGGGQDTKSATYMTLAQKLVSASGNTVSNPLSATPQQQQIHHGSGAYGPASAANHNGMHRSASMNYAASQPQYAQQSQYNNMQQMQPQANGEVCYGSQMSWDSPTGYVNPSSDVVDLPMDEDDRSLTMQANQQLYNSYNGGSSASFTGQTGYVPRGGGGISASGSMQPIQQQHQSYQGGYGQQTQMYSGMQHQQQAHYHQAPAVGAAGQGVYPYHHCQSQPNMQLHQQHPQWPQQHVPHPPLQQPMFYVPDGGAAVSGGYFVQQNVNVGSMQGVSTHASSYIQRSTSAAASLNDVEQYGMGLREEENARHSMTSHIRNILPRRPPSFSERAIEVLNAARPMIDRHAFTEFYRSMGGAQWDESVDVELAHVTVKYLMDSPILGSILVFLPGYEDIQALKEKISFDHYTGNRPSLCLLHSQLNSNDQQRVFEPTRKGERKVILSTNIAEASLTIDDVVFVIDCGKAKEKTYDHMSRISQLKCVWIAKSNAEQRRGRAGRCRPGFCFRLYSDEEFERMLPSQVAEMQRSAIHDVCLHAKMFAPERMSVKEFLQLAPEPPEACAVESSLQFLEQLGALYTEQDEDGSVSFSGSNSYFSGRTTMKEPELTQLGRLVAHLPLDPQLARLLLFGYTLRCFNPIVTLVALLSHRDPFTLAVGDEKQAALSARDSYAHRDFSDHLMILRAFSEYASIPPNRSQEQVKLCREKYLSAPTLKMVNGIRRQLLMELRRIRFINDVDGALDDPYLNEYSNKWPMVQAAIVAGSYPCIGFVKGSKMRKIRTYTESHSQLHPSSSLKRQMLSQEKRQEALQKYYMGEPTIEYLAFQEFVKIDEGLTLRTATAIPSVTIFLFAGPIRLSREKLHAYFIATREETLDETEGGQDRDFFQPRDILELESWLSVKGCTGDFIRLMQLRFKLMEYVLSVLRTPPVINDSESKMLLSTLSNVLDIEHQTKGFNEVNDVYVRNGSNPLRKSAGYDFGANTSSSSNSHKEDRRKPEAAQQSQPVKQQHVNPSSIPRSQLPFSQHTQPFQRSQHQQGQKAAEREVARASARGTTRGGGGEADRTLNWREQCTPSPSPPLQQQMSSRVDRKYPDPYRDKARDERSGNVQRTEDQHQYGRMEHKRPPQRRDDERKGQSQKGPDDRGNGFNRDERRDSERNERREAAPSKWKAEQSRTRTNTVASRFQEKRGSYGNGSMRSVAERSQRGGGYEDDDDGSNDRIPEDPQPPRQLGVGPSVRRPDDKRELGTKYSHHDKKQQYGGQLSRNQRSEPQQEEDWGKSANAPSFFSTEGGKPKPKKSLGRTFTNSNFSFKGMHSDRMNSSTPRDDDKDGGNYKQRGHRTARD